MVLRSAVEDTEETEEAEEGEEEAADATVLTGCCMLLRAAGEDKSGEARVGDVCATEYGDRARRSDTVVRTGAGAVERGLRVGDRLGEIFEGGDEDAALLVALMAGRRVVEDEALELLVLDIMILWEIAWEKVT